MQTAAIYLPGFHDCPLNSAWWGEGATEWDSVRSARSLAVNHQQPRTPSWGYYDLSDPRVIAKQAALAKEFGIDGFCIYHYWSAGKRPLRKPLEVILDNPDIDMQFCLCWANHSWFTTWKGFESPPRKLMSQTYERHRALRQAHIDFLLRALSDERAMRINDRPVMSIYDPTPTSELSDFVDHLRSEALERFGLDVFCSARVLKPKHEVTAERLLTIFDSLCLNAGVSLSKQREFRPCNGPWPNLAWLAKQFPTALKTDGLRLLYWRLTHRSHHEVTYLDYDKFVQDYLRDYRALSLLHKGKIDAQLLVDRDTTPRLKNRGSYFGNFEIGKLGKFTRELKSAVMDSNPEGILYINAWNEWGEGAYLEPDTENGLARLEAISQA